MIGVGLGLTLNHGFLADTPIERRLGIVTNEYLATNVPDVYSAGDVAEFYDPVIGQHTRWGRGITRWRMGASSPPTWPAATSRISMCRPTPARSSTPTSP